MKLKAAISDGAPQELIMAYGSRDFAQRFLADVVGKVFGAENPDTRPAEYYVQTPDQTVQVHERLIGVEVRLTGVSREGRAASVFHRALEALDELVTVTAVANLQVGQIAQIFVVMMLDKEVETAPGSGIYSNVLEANPKRVSIDGVLNQTYRA